MSPKAKNNKKQRQKAKSPGRSVSKAPKAKELDDKALEQISGGIGTSFIKIY